MEYNGNQCIYLVNIGDRIGDWMEIGELPAKLKDLEETGVLEGGGNSLIYK